MAVPVSDLVVVHCPEHLHSWLIGVLIESSKWRPVVREPTTEPPPLVVVEPI